MFSVVDSFSDMLVHFFVVLFENVHHKKPSHGPYSMHDLLIIVTRICLSTKDGAHEDGVDVSVDDVVLLSRGW